MCGATEISGALIAIEIASMFQVPACHRHISHETTGTQCVPIIRLEPRSYPRSGAVPLC